MIAGLLGAALACSTQGDAPASSSEARTMAAGSERVTFGSLASLGAFVQESTLRRTLQVEGSPPAAPEIETTVLRWGDPDGWSSARARDGRVVRSVLVREGIAWLGDTTPAVRQPDAEPFRVQLAQTWDPWDAALSVVRGQLALVDEEESSQREGRKAWRHSVHHAAPTAAGEPTGKRGRRPGAAPTWTVTSARGDVWLDEVTAVRLDVKVHVEARRTAGGGPQQTWVLELESTVHDVGTIPTLETPPSP